MKKSFLKHLFDSGPYSGGRTSQQFNEGSIRRARKNNQRNKNQRRKRGGCRK